VKQAIEVLEAALARHPGDASLRQALAEFGAHGAAQSR